MTTAACSSSGGGNDKGGGNGGGDGDGGTVSLRFAAGQSVKIGWDAVVKEFNATHSKIKVDIQYLESAKLGQIVSTQIQAGNAPDIIYATPGSGGGASGLDMYKLARTGKLEALPNKPWATDVPDVVKPAVTFEGKVYDVLVALSSYGVLYDNDALTAIGQQLPQSWDGLVGMCKTARQHGRYFTGGSGMAADNRVVLQSLAAAYVYGPNPDWDQQRTDGKVKFATTPGWKTVLEHLKQMIDSDCYAPGAAGRTRDESLKLTEEHKTVGGVTTSAGYEYRRSHSPDTGPMTFDLVPEPQGTIPLGLTGIAVASGSKHKTEAMEFVKFVAEHRELFCKPTGDFTPEQLKSGSLPEFMSPLNKMAKDGKYSLAAGTMWANSSVLRTAMEQMTGLFTGQSTVDSILKALDAAWES